MRSYKSQYRGVTWNKSAQKWQATFRFAGVQYYLGLFEDEQEAYGAYCAKAVSALGARAVLVRPVPAGSPCVTPGCEGLVVSLGLCQSCYDKARWRARSSQHADARYKRIERDPEAEALRVRRGNKAYYTKNRDRELARKAAEKHDPEVRLRNRATQRLRDANFPAELFEACWVFQAGECAICPALLDEGVSSTGACADHCHTSGAPRGVLCRPCNTALGYYEKSQRPAGLVIEPYEYYLASPPVSQLAP